LSWIPQTFKKEALGRKIFITLCLILTTTRYFAVYKLFAKIDDYPDSTHYVSYTITARVSCKNQTEFLRIIFLLAKFECINNCNGQGDCSAKLEQCICYSGFFDSDCSVSALRLNSGVPRSQTVPAQKSAYYYTSYQSIQFPVDLFYSILK